jgi:aspartate aminotransferase
VKLSQRVQSVGESATLAVTAKANAMKAKGEDVVSFGAGEPDFDTPAHIKDAAAKALAAGKTKYTASAGVPELRDAIARKLVRDNRLSVTADNITTGCGGKHVLYNAFQAVLDPGDEVVIPVPYWVSYADQVTLAGGKPVFVMGKEANSFKLSVAELKAAVTPKTRVLVINSPNNPCGYNYEPDELKAVADWAATTNLTFFSDEIYEKLVYPPSKFVSFATLAPGLQDKTITFNGLAKTYSMTGWRVGYAAGPVNVIKAMTNLASHSTSHVTSFAQYGAVAALNGDQGCVETMRIQFEKRAKLIHQRLNAVPGVTCIRPAGAFYAFPNVSSHYAKFAPKADIPRSLQFAEKVLDAVKVAVVPGCAFGADDYVRLSFATSEDQINKGIDRLEKFLKG